MTRRHASRTAAPAARRLGLLAVVCGLVTLPGCMALALGPSMLASQLTTCYKRVEFRTIDAASGRAVPGATVSVHYQGMRGAIPHDVSGVTDDDGRLALRVAVGNNAYTDVAAPGYLPLHDRYVLGLDPLDRVVLPLHPAGSAAPLRAAATIAP